MIRLSSSSVLLRCRPPKARVAAISSTASPVTNRHLSAPKVAKRQAKAPGAVFKGVGGKFESVPNNAQAARPTTADNPGVSFRGIGAGGAAPYPAPQASQRDIEASWEAAFQRVRDPFAKARQQRGGRSNV